MTIQKFEVPDWIRSVLICDPTDIWGNVVGMGLAELAAVLSPAKRFDRRGSVYLLDSFESGIAGCDTDLSGAGASVSVSSEAARTGGLVAKLVGGSTLTRYATVWYKLPLPPLSKIGVEMTFSLDSNVDRVAIIINYIDGTYEHYSGIRYNTASNSWQYVDASGAWVDFVTSTYLSEVDHLFHLAKVVVDPATNKYVRALVSGQEVNMSAYSTYRYASTINPYLEVEIFAYSEAGVNGTVLVDNVIVTVNEPA